MTIQFAFMLFCMWIFGVTNGVMSSYPGKFQKYHLGLALFAGLAIWYSLAVNVFL